MLSVTLTRYPVSTLSAAPAVPALSRPSTEPDMRIALAILVALYSLLAMGDYHEAAVVTPMQVIMGLTIIPMCILAVGLLFSGLMGLSTKEARTQNIVIAVLAATLLVVVGYRELRRSNRSRSEAIPYNPQAGEH
jgi:hypothetical protein